MPAMRPIATRLVAITSLLLVASTLAACGLTAVSGPREWGLSTEQADGTKRDVVVRDTSGRITDVVIDPQGIQMPGAITNPNGDLMTLLVPWSGGACDVKTEIEFAARGQGLAGTIKTQTTGEVCVMMAVQHLLELKLNTPVPAASVTLEPAPAAVQ